IQAHPELDHRLIVTGAHLSPEFGHSINEIESAGFSVDFQTESLLSSDSDVGMAKTIGVATLGLADLLGKLRPDILLLIADRYEMLAPAATALALRIPIAHIEGGEISEGAIDDAVRNALTKMSHLHFTPNTQASARVLAMGEEAWRVHAVGAPSIDTLLNSPRLDRQQLQDALGIGLDDRFLLAAIHPVTLLDDTLAEADAFFSGISNLSQQLLFCFPNADAGARQLIGRAREYCSGREKSQVFVNLAPDLYWSLLAESAALLGNSSSGIMETPALPVPAVNIGIRQQGRLRAANIIDVEAESNSIRDAITTAISPEFRASLAGMHNPYGDGTAGEKIAQTLAAAPGLATLLGKRALPVRQVDDLDFVFRHGREPAG
ncbi:MAG: UDP-N-acetylglucosamine 2-epimerase (hydrolyzing), partial [Gammaproteobacteria bacterium]|nr:UDP-N-acetylglucosamine 2-epimerase (hydrolyzing) [Gammaproteobacteria bacterium]